jgi:WD40 repeat protein
VDLTFVLTTRKNDIQYTDNGLTRVFPRPIATGTDHAVYEVDVKTCKKLRTLYTKTHGHKEWVTKVRCLPDGRVLSSGMDSLICLWDARGTRCSALEGHNGSGAFYTLVPIRSRWRGGRRSLRTFAGVSLRLPLAFNPRPRCLSTPLLTPFNSTPTSLCMERPSVSDVAVGASGLTAVSAGYDKTLKLWNLAPKGFTARSDRCVGTLHGHKAPVTTLAWGERRVAKNAEEKKDQDDASGGLGSGDRDGVVMLWDAGSGAAVGRRGGHRGHVTSLAWIDGGGGGGGAVLLRCVLYKRFSPIARFQHLIAPPFN